MPFNRTRSVVDCFVCCAQQWDEVFVYLDRDRVHFFIDSEPFSCLRRFFRIIFGRRQIREIWYFCLKSLSLSHKQYWNEEEEYFSALPCLRRPVTFKSQFSCIWFCLQDLSQSYLALIPPCFLLRLLQRFKMFSSRRWMMKKRCEYEVSFLIFRFSKEISLP